MWGDRAAPRPRFHLKTGQFILTGIAFRKYQLQRHCPAQRTLSGLKHDSHPAACDFLNQLEIPNHRRLRMPIDRVVKRLDGWRD